MSTRGVHLVVPVKDPADAKQRLGELLDASLRASLFRAMVADAFNAIAQSVELASVSVVTRDAQISEQARLAGFDTIGEPDNSGHTSAVTRGFEVLKTRAVFAAMTLPADLPCLTATDIDSLVTQFHASQASTRCLLVPAADYAGTNAAILAPPDLFQFRFGDNSFYPHVDAAKRAGVDPLVVENDNIALDVDTPEDLARLAVKRCGDETAAWLLAHQQVTGIQPL